MDGCDQVVDDPRPFCCGLDCCIPLSNSCVDVKILPCFLLLLLYRRPNGLSACSVTFARCLNQSVESCFNGLSSLEGKRCEPCRRATKETVATHGGIANIILWTETRALNLLFVFHLCWERLVVKLGPSRPTLIEVGVSILNPFVISMNGVSLLPG